MNKCAFVTGGSRGIGNGIVKELAEEGYDVAFTYSTAIEDAKEVMEYVQGVGRRCFYYQASLENADVPEKVTQQAISDLGRLDLLVCNAGVTKFNDVLKTPAQEIDFLYGLNFRAVVLCSKIAGNHMKENDIKGNIIIISSTHGCRAYPNDAIYGSLKAGLNRFTESLALELCHYGIRVNCIAPGFTLIREGKREEWVAKMESKVPLQRFGTPKEVARAILYLTSEDAGYITGVTLKMDGGLVLPGMPEDTSPEAGYGWARPKNRR